MGERSMEDLAFWQSIDRALREARVGDFTPEHVAISAEWAQRARRERDDLALAVIEGREQKYRDVPVLWGTAASGVTAWRGSEMRFFAVPPPPNTQDQS